MIRYLRAVRAAARLTERAVLGIVKRGGGLDIWVLI
jgi:hypothetical protein